MEPNVVFQHPRGSKTSNFSKKNDNLDKNKKKMTAMECADIATDGTLLFHQVWFQVLMSTERQNYSQVSFSNTFRDF